MYHMVVEQTSEYPKRMAYDPETGSFTATAYDSLAFCRNVLFPYGWLKESGTPPGRHMDVILISSAAYRLGDAVPVKIIGVFLRNDGDNKLVAVPAERAEEQYTQLPDADKNILHRLYPRIDSGEGWFDADKAGAVMEEYYTRDKMKR